MSYITDKFADQEMHFNAEGALVWNSNDRCLMQDAMEELLADGSVVQSQVDITARVRDEQNSAFIAEYREAQANRTPEQIAEERFEMRAAFGPGETVVNVFTGERTIT